MLQYVDIPHISADYSLIEFIIHDMEQDFKKKVKKILDKGRQQYLIGIGPALSPPLFVAMRTAKACGLTEEGLPREDNTAQKGTVIPSQ